MKQLYLWGDNTRIPSQGADSRLVTRSQHSGSNRPSNGTINCLQLCNALIESCFQSESKISEKVRGKQPENLLLDLRRTSGKTLGFFKLQHLKKKRSIRRRWPLHVHNDFQTHLFETTWHGPHSTPRITRKFPAIGPLQYLWPVASNFRKTRPISLANAPKQSRLLRRRVPLLSGRHKGSARLLTSQ